MKINKYWFSFSEILIVISILVVISIIGTTTYSSMQTKTTNSKVLSDLKALNNAFLLSSKENKTLPLPSWNLNYYKEDTSYAHDYESAFWVSWFFYENTLTKKYINYLPFDPKTNQLYAYWKTKDTLAYEISWIIYDQDQPVSLVMWNWWGENWPYNLIKEYSWPNFVTDWSKNYFPYNPNEKRLVAKISSYSWELQINDKIIIDDNVKNLELLAWDKITISQNWFAEIYISDWSSTIIWDKNSKSELIIKNFNFKDNTNIFTSVKLALNFWSVWTKASKLSEKSTFDIETDDTVAAVRWTIFWVSKNNWISQVTLIEWKLDVNNLQNNNLIKDLKVNAWENPSWVNIDWNLTISSTWNILQIPDFVKEKALTWKADFNENMSLKLSSKSWSTLNISLTDILKNYQEVYLNDKILKDTDFKLNWSILSIFNLDFKIENRIKLCKNTFCTREIIIEPILTDLSFTDLESKNDLLKLNDDSLNWDDLKEHISKLEEKKYIENNIWNKFFRQYFYWDFEVVWYAPYDTSGDLKMYSNWIDIVSSWSKVSPDNECKPLLSGSLFEKCETGNSVNYPNTISYDTNNSFFDYNWTKWIFIDNEWNDEYLSYWYSLTNTDFALEIWVRWSALKRSDNKVYTLFSFWNNNNIILKESQLSYWNLKLNDYSNLLEDDKNYLVIFKRDKQINSLEILDEDWNVIKNTSIPNSRFIPIEKIYIWSSVSYSTTNNTLFNNHWHDIINHVKIYKKNSNLLNNNSWIITTTP